MSQVKRSLILTLILSDTNFERITKIDPASLHMKSVEERRTILIKSLSHSEVWYNANWQFPEVRKMQDPWDFIKFYAMEQFECFPVEKEEKKLFYHLHFAIPANKNKLKKFLTWFRKFVIKKKIPLEKENGYRAFFNPCGLLTESELDELSCLKVTDTKYAVILSFESHYRFLEKLLKMKEKKELQMKKAKELANKVRQKEWDEETDELKTKKTRKKKSSDEKPKKVKEEKKVKKVKEPADPSVVVTKNIKDYLKENLGDGVVAFTKVDVDKALKGEPSKGLVKAVIENLSKKYNIIMDKGDDDTIVYIWKKHKKLPKKLFKF